MDEVEIVQEEDVIVVKNYKHENTSYYKCIKTYYEKGNNKNLTMPTSISRKINELIVKECPCLSKTESYTYQKLYYSLQRLYQYSYWIENKKTSHNYKNCK